MVVSLDGCNEGVIEDGGGVFVLGLAFEDEGEEDPLFGDFVVILSKLEEVEGEEAIWTEGHHLTFFSFT